MRRSPTPDRQEGPFPLSVSELARRSSRAKSSISEALAHKLAAARLPSGRVDARHPVIIAWAIERGVDPAVLVQPISVVRAAARREDTATSTAAPATPSSSARSSSPTTPTLLRGGFNDPPNVDALQDMTVRDIVKRFGSLTGLSDYLDVRRKSVDCKRIEISNREREGALISRELVRVHVIEAIAATYRRLLSDAPKTITTRVYAAVKAGQPIEEVERIVHDVISSTLSALKQNAMRALRSIRESEHDAA